MCSVSTDSVNIVDQAEVSLNVSVKPTSGALTPFYKLTAEEQLYACHNNPNHSYAREATEIKLYPVGDRLMELPDRVVLPQYQAPVLGAAVGRVDASSKKS